MKGVMEGQGKADPSPHNIRLLSDTGSDSACFLCGRQEKTFKWGRGGGVRGGKITSSIHSTAHVIEFFFLHIDLIVSFVGEKKLSCTPDLKLK